MRLLLNPNAVILSAAKDLLKILRPDGLRMTFLILAICVSPALAQDQTTDEGFVYSPDGCEFQITFPEEPHVSRRCHDALEERCDLMTTYTKVYELDAAINVYVSCRPIEEDFRGQFTPDMLRTALIARPGVADLEVYDISFQETDKALMGALLGAGPTPNDNDAMIYVAQIWAGDTSLFTLEGELIGSQQEEADRLFARILRSLHHVDWEPATADGAENGETAEPETAETIKEKPVEQSE